MHHVVAEIDEDVLPDGDGAREAHVVLVEAVVNHGRRQDQSLRAARGLFGYVLHQHVVHIDRQVVSVLLDGRHRNDNHRALLRAFPDLGPGQSSIQVFGHENVVSIIPGERSIAHCVDTIGYATKENPLVTAQASLPRRELLLGSALGGGPSAAGGFEHRGYLGWITDLATEPDTNAAWPSMRLDERLLEDYRHTFALMKRLGFKEAVIWGFYVSRAWPVDISSAVGKERGAMVEKLIGLAHAQGLGVYSWGFEQIIRAHPELSRTNPRAMCASRPEAWEWMRRVIDFVFTRFPVDGASLQSADQGRCECAECRRYADTEYHVRLDVRVSEYVRSRWRDRTLAVSGWGMRFDNPGDLPHLVELSKHIDYLIDVPDSAARRDPAWRRTLIGALDCRFGTIGGPQVEPPQHWQRDRWFLPTPKHQGEHLASLYGDGGRACEFFFHILANPGDEVSFWVAGKALSDPTAGWQHHLESTLDELYRTRKAATADLMNLFVRAEDAYLSLVPAIRSATISLEPLIGDRPGPPVYLAQRLGPEQRRTYRREVETLSAEFRKLGRDVPEKGRMRKILRCLDNVRADLDSLPR